MKVSDGQAYNSERRQTPGTRRGEEQSLISDLDKPTSRMGTDPNDFIRHQPDFSLVAEGPLFDGISCCMTHAQRGTVGFSAVFEPEGQRLADATAGAFDSGSCMAQPLFCGSDQRAASVTFARCKIDTVN
jgi:hypothetical protein